MDTGTISARGCARERAVGRVPVGIGQEKRDEEIAWQMGGPSPIILLGNGTDRTSAVKAYPWPSPLQSVASPVPNRRRIRLRRTAPSVARPRRAINPSRALWPTTVRDCSPDKVRDRSAAGNAETGGGERTAGRRQRGGRRGPHRPQRHDRPPPRGGRLLCRGRGRPCRRVVRPRPRPAGLRARRRPRHAGVRGVRGRHQLGLLGAGDEPGPGLDQGVPQPGLEAVAGAVAPQVGQD
jgi:hypothetical protein